ncbi:MAG TPA: hypothetical protein VF800_04500 [Telluria sp.]
MEQTGNLNKVTLDQNNAVYSGVQVQQEGNGNNASVKQKDSYFTREQTIIQKGNYNVASADEQGNDNASKIVQTGNLNKATVVQRLDYSQSLINQTGNNNIASVTQNGGNNYDKPNIASIIQTGNGFAATITQSGSGNHAGVVQH